MYVRGKNDCILEHKLKAVRRALHSWPDLERVHNTLVDSRRKSQYPPIITTDKEKEKVVSHALERRGKDEMLGKRVKEKGVGLQSTYHVLI